jgi:ribonuclease P/MRP protein subunit POP3
MAYSKFFASKLILCFQALWTAQLEFSCTTNGELLFARNPANRRIGLDLSRVTNEREKCVVVYGCCYQLTFVTMKLTIRSLLSPIGHYHRARKDGSKKMRSKSRQRKRKHQTSGPDGGVESSATAFSQVPRPEIVDHLTVGFNATTKHLEHLVSPQSSGVTAPPGQVTRPLKPLSVVFLSSPPVTASSGNQIPVQFSHFPTLCSLASQRHETPVSSTLIIPLSQHSFSQIALQLNIPRLIALGVIEDAPGAAPLLSYMRGEGIQPVRNIWLENALQEERRAQALQWMETNIAVEEVVVKKKKTQATKNN